MQKKGERKNIVLFCFNGTKYKANSKMVVLISVKTKYIRKYIKCKGTKYST